MACLPDPATGILALFPLGVAKERTGFSFWTLRISWLWVWFWRENPIVCNLLSWRFSFIRLGGCLGKPLAPNTCLLSRARYLQRLSAQVGDLVPKGIPGGERKATRWEDRWLSFNNRVWPAAYSFTQLSGQNWASSSDAGLWYLVSSDSGLRAFLAEPSCWNANPRAVLPFKFTFCFLKKNTGQVFLDTLCIRLSRYSMFESPGAHGKSAQLYFWLLRRERKQRSRGWTGVA